MRNFQVYEAGGIPIKAWVNGVPFTTKARLQLERVSRLSIAHKWVAALPDVHPGMAATIGSVIITKDAVIPAAVGVDIGCGMRGVLTTLNRDDLVNLAKIRACIESLIPTGFNSHNRLSKETKLLWEELDDGHFKVVENMPSVTNDNVRLQLGTLGGGNHFIELCLDEEGRVWIVIHSGSRGIGNRIGQGYTKLARKLCAQWHIKLEDRDLAYLPRGEKAFSDYMQAATWAQRYAYKNRERMMQIVLEALGATATESFDCHHNYITWENHYGDNVLVTRKGAVSAKEGQVGIIPGSMGARSYIVKGLGNPQSFNSCAHGAGRAMSRSGAKKVLSVEEHVAATEGVECRKDKGMLDESPGAYKDIDAVMEAQKDLCEPVHTLKQFLCVKG